jgi:hypothetical protein
MKRKFSLRRELRDRRNWVWIGMSSYGTIVWFISWITSPQGQQVIQHLGRLA